MSSPITYTIPFRHPHGGIVIGSGGRTVKGICHDTGCKIRSMKPDRDRRKPLPYFLIEGPNEKSVNQATIRVQGLLLTSMMNAERKTTSGSSHGGAHRASPPRDDGYGNASHDDGYGNSQAHAQSAPKSPVYSPKSPAYSPQSPSYSPQSPTSPPISDSAGGGGDSVKGKKKFKKKSSGK